MRKVLVTLGLLLVLGACKKEDDPVEIVPPRFLSEVAPENDAEIRAFLDSHFYNYEDFENPPANFDYRIVLDTIAGDNSDKRPRSEFVQSGTTLVNSFEFTVDYNETDIEHTYYYFTAREGEGPKPSVADSVFVRYQGQLLDGNLFDQVADGGVWFDLAQIQAPLQGFRGFTEGMQHFKTGGTPIVNNDGTFSVENYGIGMFIFPSGLGGFNSLTARIPQYSPLIFQVDLLTYNPTDHDGDGIPSIQEDLNGNGYLYDDNTDADYENEINSNRFADFLDSDDDGDGYRTRLEITFDQEGNPVFLDTDGDGVFDHLDADSWPPSAEEEDN